MQENDLECGAWSAAREGASQTCAVQGLLRHPLTVVPLFAAGIRPGQPRLYSGHTLGYTRKHRAAVAIRGETDLRELLFKVDHLVYLAFDLPKEARRLEDLLGARAVPGGKHPAWGTHNALISLGDEAYLEILAPDPDHAGPDRPRPFGLDQLESPGLATWAVRSNHLELVVKHGRHLGVDLGTVLSGSRKQTDGKLLQWRLTDLFVPREGGIVPFFIDWGETPHPAAALSKGCSLIGLRACHPDAQRVQSLLTGLGLELPVQHGPMPALVARIRTSRGVVELQNFGPRN